MTDSKCRAIRSSGKCDCSTFVLSTRSEGLFPVCATEGCGHTDQIHSGYADRKGLTKSAPKVESIAKTVAKADIVSDNGSEPTSKVMRAILIKNKIPGVGERGRLRPEHITKAKELLANAR